MMRQAAVAWIKFRKNYSTGEYDTEAGTEIRRFIALLQRATWIRCRELLHCKYDPKDEHGLTPPHMAASSGHLDQVPAGLI